MKNPFLVVSLVILLCFVFGCQKQAEEVAEKAAAEVAALSVEDVAAIKTLHDAYVQAVLAGGLEATVKFYAEDAILIAKGPIIQGREAFKKSLEGLSKASATITAFNLALAEIDGRDDLAFVRGTVSMSMTSKGAPEPIQFTGKFLEILRKQEDGSWLIARDIRVSD
jgi:uncharacterized protein (TIGR02246 family)